MIHALHRAIDRPRPWRRLHIRGARTQRYEIRAEDGQLLVVHRMRPLKPAGGPPVMLLHGLGSNYRGFDFPERSFAGWLADRGHDVWMPELRGHGESFRARYDWRLDDYLQYDIPAVLTLMERETERSDLAWVGHSMGGVLLYCYGIMHDEVPITRGVAIASALDYRVGATDFRRLLKLRPVIEPMVAVPWGTLVHMLAPGLGRGFEKLEAFNVWPDNIDPRVTRRLHAQCFHSIPISLLGSLATSFEFGGLRTHDGFHFLKKAHTLDFPLHLLAGSRDKQVSADAIAHTQMLVGANASVRVHGRGYGDAEHYGHWDLIVGDRAHVEVWPGIADFLES